MELNKIHTSCQACVFVAYGQTPEGLAQTGCKLGCLDRFKARGAEVVSAQNETSKFFIINGRTCPLKRDQRSHWAKSHNAADYARIAREEARPRMEVLVPIRVGDLLEEVQWTIESIDKQRVKPFRVELILNQEDLHPLQLTELCENTSIPEWNVRKMLERTESGGFVSLERCIDLSVIGSKSQFYVVMLPGFTPPDTFLADIDKAIVDELQQFIYLQPAMDHEGTDRTSGMVVNTQVHTILGGNRPVTVEMDGKTIPLNTIGEKISFRVKEEGLPHLVRSVRDVCRM